MMIFEFSTFEIVSTFEISILHCEIFEVPPEREGMVFFVMLIIKKRLFCKRLWLLSIRNLS